MKDDDIIERIVLTRFGLGDKVVVVGRWRDPFFFVMRWVGFYVIVACVAFYVVMFQFPFACFVLGFTIGRWIEKRFDRSENV